MPRKKRDPEVRFVFAAATVAVRETGSKYPTTVQQGTAWHADAPLVLAHPDLFTDEPPVVFPRGWQPQVEQATAAPGEQRESGRDH